MNYVKDIPFEVLTRAEHEPVEIFGRRVMRIYTEAAGLCRPYGIECAFYQDAKISCGRCLPSVFWVPEEQLPKILAAKLTE